MLKQLDARTLRGSVIAVPVVNVFGFVEQSRYLPDGRDLNRSFPGSKRGSLAARLADIFKVLPGVAQAERLPGAVGITMDDVVAGLYGLAAGWIVAWML